MKPKAIDFVYYTVSDLTTSVAFYRDTLGLNLERLNEDGGWAEFELPPTTLALDSNAPVSVTSGEGSVGIALAVDDVEAATEELEEKGVNISMEPTENSVCDISMITDPDGNSIALHCRHNGTYGRQDPFL